MQFQSTHPLRGATGGSGRHNSAQRFQSTHPLRGATWYKFLTFLLKNFNPRTPCGVRRIYGLFVDFVTIISIHAPLAGCDELTEQIRHVEIISIHAPLAGCDSFVEADGGMWKLISIHAPLAGCDRAFLELQPALVYFNPRTPCGVRLCVQG